jgi:DNA-binding beta-propeller fold protein YncE
VVHAAFQGGFYAGGVVLAPDGSHAWVLDSNTAANGGGVYEIAIGCDGTLTSRGLVIPGGGATAMTLLPADPTKALLAARKAFQSAANTDVHVVDLAGHTLIGSAAAFGDMDAIVSSIAVMPDGKYALVADDGVVVGSRVAVMSLVPGLAPVSILPTPYPAAVVASPFGNAAIVLNDDSTDEIHVLSYDATKPAPFVITGELAYKFPKPQIPVTAATIDRGALRGTVLIGENVGVRRVVFSANGAVTDTQKLSFPDGIPNVVGVVGVQP